MLVCAWYSSADFLLALLVQLSYAKLDCVCALTRTGPYTVLLCAVKYRATVGR